MSCTGRPGSSSTARGGIPFEAGQFKLNGIVAKGSRRLVVVDPYSGKLFRIELGDDRS